jgi:hypothetical protein
MAGTRMVNPGNFQVAFSQTVRDQVRALTRRANKRGIGAEFRADLEFIIERLMTDPLGWGDPNYRLHNLGLLVCRGLRPLVYVYYAVDDVRRIVHLTRFKRPLVVLLILPSARTCYMVADNDRVF